MDLLRKTAPLIIALVTLNLSAISSAIAHEKQDTLISSGFIEVPNKQKARLVLSNPTARGQNQSRELKAQVVIRNAKGRVIARNKGLVSAFAPLIVEAPKRQSGKQALLVSAEVVVSSDDTERLKTCPLNLTLQATNVDADDSGAVSGCSVDPCCDDCGQVGQSGVHAMCTSGGILTQ